MEYKPGYVYELMEQGGPTDVQEPYFKEAVDEMMRARVLCARANAKMPDDPSYVEDLEELFGRKLVHQPLRHPLRLRRHRVRRRFHGRSRTAHRHHQS